MTTLRHSGKVVAEARRLHAESDGAWRGAEIARQLERSHGVKPTRETIMRWIDPEYDERVRERTTQKNRERWAKRWTFALAATATDDYRVAFVKRLRAEGVPKASIAKVCTVVFAERWTRDRVDVVLGHR